MFSNVALDVVIGLVFIYMLYSLLATIIQETLAHLLNLRARMLTKTVRILLDDRVPTDANVMVRWYSHVRSNVEHWWCPLKGKTFSKAFYAHPSIKYLGQSSWRSKPSYIAASNFSSTIIQMLRGSNFNGIESQMAAIYRTLFETKSLDGPVRTTIDKETLTHLQLLYIDSGKDIEQFRILLEGWFEETMERAGGWYKKQTQWILLLIGLSIAATFNVDSIAISKLLSKDKTAREGLVQMAIEAAPKYENSIGLVQRSGQQISFRDTIKTANGADTIITRTRHVINEPERKEIDSVYKILNTDINNASGILGLGRERSSRNSSTVWMGWILTALAISLGAPFWFDILNKVVQLRSSIAKPKDADTGGGSTKLKDSGSSQAKKRVG